MVLGILFYLSESLFQMLEYPTQIQYVIEQQYGHLEQIPTQSHQ